MRRGAAAFAASAVLVTGACGAEQPSAERSTSPSSAATSPSSTPPPDADPLPARVVSDLEDVIAAHPDDDIAVAVVPVGTGTRTSGVGVVSSATRPEALVAWSTIKVPLALAATEASSAPTRAAVRHDTTQAITASDNDAASRLWDGLGGGEEAADAVEKVLADGGDRQTQVPPQTTVAGYSPFGQARWRLVDQARFTAALPCLKGASSVLGPMGRVEPGHAWGLGSITGARYKGGWGPTPDGYVTRQLGVLPGRQKGEKVAVAVQVRSADHAGGTAVISEVAEVLERHRARLPDGSCR